MKNIFKVLLVVTIGFGFIIYGVGRYVNKSTNVKTSMSTSKVTTEETEVDSVIIFDHGSINVFYKDFTYYAGNSLEDLAVNMTERTGVTYAVLDGKILRVSDGKCEPVEVITVVPK